MTLRDQRKVFCEEYAKRFNGTDAAIAAGYSPHTATVIATRMLKDPKVKDYIKELVQVDIGAVRADVEVILEELSTRILLDPKDLFEDDGSVKRLCDMPLSARRCIESLDVVELFQGTGDQKQAIGLVKKIKLTSRDKAVDQMAKYLGMQTERHMHMNPDGSALAPKIEIVIRDPKEEK
jgi:phage terminase small subunit